MLKLEQLLAGRDFATADRAAAQMLNFVYVIADDESRQALLVDPAWDVAGLVAHVENAGYTLVGALATHYHPDHVGGDLWGLAVEGVAGLRALRDVAVHAHEAEVRAIATVTGLAESDVTAHAAGDTLALGETRVEFVHTPGHSPGSTCYRVSHPGVAAGEAGHREAPALLTGDTLFAGACGRVDLPGSDPDEMFRTLTERLGRLPAATVVFPGHDYGPTPTTTLEHERRTNPYLQFASLEDWRRGMRG